MPTGDYRDRFPTLEEFDEEMSVAHRDFDESFVASMRRALAVVYAIAQVMDAPMHETLTQLAPVSPPRDVVTIATMRAREAAVARSTTDYLMVAHGREPVQRLRAIHSCPQSSSHATRHGCLVEVGEGDDAKLQRVSHFRDNVMFVE